MGEDQRGSLDFLSGSGSISWLITSKSFKSKLKKAGSQSESSTIWILALFERWGNVDDHIKGFCENLLFIKDLNLRFKLTYFFLATMGDELIEPINELNKCSQLRQLEPRYKIIYTLGYLLLDFKEVDVQQKDNWSVLIRSANSTGKVLDYRSQEKLVSSLFQILMNDMMNPENKKIIIRDVILGSLGKDIASISKRSQEKKDKKKDKKKAKKNRRDPIEVVKFFNLRDAQDMTVDKPEQVKSFLKQVILFDMAMKLNLLDELSDLVGKVNKGDRVDGNALSDTVHPYFSEKFGFSQKELRIILPMLSNAWLVYGEGLLRLPDNSILLAEYRELLVAVASGSYKELRYSVDNDHNPHLQKVFLGTDQLAEKWQESLSCQKINRRRKEFSVVDTDDVGDLLLCGIGGSCQNYAGDPRFNRGLLAYMRDGKRRMIAIKDSNGCLVSRSLLQEPVYGDQRFIDELDAMCQSKAKELSLVLYRKIELPTEHKCIIHQGNSKFNYHDSGSKLVSGGDEVRDVEKVFNPCSFSAEVQGRQQQSNVGKRFR